MKIRYYQDTDTLYIEFRAADVAETRDLDEDTLLDLDAEGNICGITVEHAQKRVEDIPHVSLSKSASSRALRTRKTVNLATLAPNRPYLAFS